MKVKITHDVFNIVKRLKAINKNYFIMFNTKTNKYEIHNLKYKNTLCLVLPYNALDNRAITYVLKSERVEEQLELIEKTNLKIEKSNKEKLNDKINYQLKEIYSYANKKVNDFDGDGFKFNWC